MSEKFNLEQISQFWTQQAVKYGESSSASWSDRMAIELELREMLKRLTDGDKILDIGCANGYSTLRLAAHKQVHIRGLDFIPEMIEQARLHLSRVSDQLQGIAEFDIGDIRALDEPPAAYDKVIVTRVIINLGDWTHQQQGLCECTRVLKPGGILLLSEATLQGWQQLNAFRNEWGLPDIPEPSFNRYVDQEQIIEAVLPELQLVELVNFSSTYYVGTRVLKPLLIKALGADIDVANPDMEWNRWCAQLPSWGDYGVQKLFVFRKT